MAGKNKNGDAEDLARPGAGGAPLRLAPAT